MQLSGVILVTDAFCPGLCLSPNIVGQITKSVSVDPSARLCRRCHILSSGTPTPKAIDNIIYNTIYKTILSCATFPGAPSYGGVRTWVEGSKMHGYRALAEASNLQYIAYKMIQLFGKSTIIIDNR